MTAATSSAAANPILRFIQAPSFGGILLAFAALAALVISNSPWADAYEALQNLPGELRIGSGAHALVLAKPALVWVNDLWMAVFFLLVGLEIKREFVKGELSTARDALLPAAAALGGMAVPALIYTAINWGDAVALRGWAVPSATDIAFALGILILLGDRVPASLKVFLTAVAIIDDLGAIVVIALFYTSQLSLLMLLGAALVALGLFALNRLGVKAVGPYMVLGLLMWLLVLKSGVHATLAGVVTALAVPIASVDAVQAGADSPLERTENALHPWVTYLILPSFAFLNAGVSLEGITPGALLAPVPLGIAAGLVVGKAVGVGAVVWAMVSFGGARLPAGATRLQFFGVAILCGVGFTMSLFIGSLAFTGADPLYWTQVKIGVLAGSLVSGILGALVLLRACPKK